MVWLLFGKGNGKVKGKGIHSQNDKDPYTSQKFGILKYSVPDFLKNNLSLSGLIKVSRLKDGGLLTNL